MTGWWFGKWIIFPYIIGNFIILTDGLVFFRRVGIPPTSIDYTDFVRWLGNVNLQYI